MTIRKWSTSRRVAAVVCAALITTAGVAYRESTGQQPNAGVRLSRDGHLHAMLPARVRERGVLTVVTDASYPPMSSFGPDGRAIVGFEPDLGRALGDLLGVDFVFEQATFDQLLALVESGRADVAMSAITDTPEREKRVDFINYFAAGSSILIQSDNPARITGVRDLCGQTVAVESGTVQVDLLRRYSRQCGAAIVVKQFKTNSDALLELRTGRAVAVLSDYPVAVHVTKSTKTRAHLKLASPVQYERGLYGIAVAKHDAELQRAISEALRGLRGAGYYDELLERWDVSAGRVDGVTINRRRVGTPVAITGSTQPSVVASL